MAALALAGVGLGAERLLGGLELHGAFGEDRRHLLGDGWAGMEDVLEAGLVEAIAFDIALRRDGGAARLAGCFLRQLPRARLAIQHDRARQLSRACARVWCASTLGLLRQFPRAVFYIQ